MIRGACYEQGGVMKALSEVWASATAWARERALACARPAAWGWAAIGGAVLMAGGCRPVVSPAHGPEAACVDACAVSAARCGAVGCTRGCNLILDRLVENEGSGVLACVAPSSGPCDHPPWARCAARVGPPADRGPPAPPPPPAALE